VVFKGVTLSGRQAMVINKGRQKFVHDMYHRLRNKRLGKPSIKTIPPCQKTPASDKKPHFNFNQGKELIDHQLICERVITVTIKGDLKPAKKIFSAGTNLPSSDDNNAIILKLSFALKRSMTFFLHFS